MTESMIERVAVAIARARGMLPTSKVIPQEALWLYFPKDQAFKEARAAIEEKRESTEAMWLADGLRTLGKLLSTPLSHGQQDQQTVQACQWRRIRQSPSDRSRGICTL